MAISSMGRSSTRTLRSRRPATTERASFIDGVYPPNEVELDARPQEEACSTVRLESEADDYSPVRERW